MQHLKLYFNSLVSFLHASPPLMSQLVVVVVRRLPLPRESMSMCVCACACTCLSHPVFLSSLQSFSLHLVLIRTNTVEVSRENSCTLFLCACWGWHVLTMRCDAEPWCIPIPYVCIFMRVYFSLSEIHLVKMAGPVCEVRLLDCGKLRKRQRFCLMCTGTDTSHPNST